MNEKTTNSIINLDLPPSIDNAVNNITDKPSSAIGTTLADIWSLVFGKISFHADKQRLKYAHELEQYKNELSFCIDQIPEEKFINPSLQTTAQALENSKYCIEEKELRNMFVSLISNSMNSDFQKDIHPSFAEILKQMSSLDAEVIKVFKGSTLGFPLCRYEIIENGGYITLLDNVFLEYQNTDLSLSSLSISSLARLGLIKTTYEDVFIDEQTYIPFIKHFWFKMLQQKYPDKKLDVHHGIVFLTPLGRSFTRVCIPD